MALRVPTVDAARELVCYAIDRGMVEPDDAVWAYNTVLASVGARGPVECPGVTHGQIEALPAGERFARLLDALLPVAQANGVESALADDDGASFSAHVMGALMPRPSQVTARFNERLASCDPVGAASEFYRLCVDADYVRTRAIARNLSWTSPSRWGDLEITVNLSKPEKDPRAIAAAARVAGANSAQDAPYPACQLCIENEGYAGRVDGDPCGAHPARQNLRVVPLELGGERWGFQYSPYAYYDEHCIVMSQEHRPMHVDRENMARLLDFVDLLPQYFVGSNADLPLVGGSILSHDHFQGGRHVFAMDRAPMTQTFYMPAYPQIRAGVVRWPASVVRLMGVDREQLLAAASYVLEVWRAWDDAALGIFARTDGVAHNTMTPFAHREAGAAGVVYRLDLALRCNMTSEAHPLGVFHPHARLHHIKRENIGLIEVAGLAILPGRLSRELDAVARRLLDGSDLDADPLTRLHASWARDVAAHHPELDRGNVSAILRGEVGEVFSQVLEDVGVYKWDESGRAGMRRFLQGLGAQLD